VTAMTKDLPPALHAPFASGLGQGGGISPGRGRAARRKSDEPKWDGYRSCALVGVGGVSVYSGRATVSLALVEP
jgi:hypothetical protein